MEWSSNAFSIRTSDLEMRISDDVTQGSRVTLTHALKLNDKIYCIFKEQSLYSYKKKRKHFVAIDLGTEKMTWLDFPQKMNDAFYFDLFARDQKIILLDYHGDDHFSYDPTENKWTQIADVGDVIYIDDDYRIAYQDRGEWGEYTWFQNTRTNQEYVIAEDGKYINRIDDNYFLTSEGRIIEINDPDQLSRCASNCYFSANEDHLSQQPTSMNEQIVKFLYNDSIYSDWDLSKRKLHIMSSWVYENELFHLYNTASTTAIGQVVEGELISKALLPNRYAIRDPHYSYRGVNAENDKRFHFYKESENTYGFIMIDNNHIDIVNLQHNQDSLEYLGSNFVEFWHHVELLMNRDLVFADILKYENNSSGVYLNEHRSGDLHSGLHPKSIVDKNSHFDKFVRVENEFVSQITEYHYDHTTDEIKSISTEWTETVPYKTRDGYKSLFSTNEGLVASFAEKYEDISKYISHELQISPVVDSTSNYYLRTKWEISKEHQLVLSVPKEMSRNPEIRLLIY